MWIAGVCLCLLAALGIVAIARTTPASYANIPREDARTEDPQALVTLEPPTVNRPSRAPCPECGVIESMRQIERSSDSGREGVVDVKVARGIPNTLSGGPITANTVTGKSYEFTVRFRDGSTTVFSDVGPRAWRVGSRVMVIRRPNTVNN